MDITQKWIPFSAPRLRARAVLMPIFGVLLFLLGWQALAQWGGLPAFILPSPAQVGARFVRALAEGSLARHTGITLGEVLLGLVRGVSAGTILGYLAAKHKALEEFLAPALAASQAIPIVALAPLLVIWFGAGIFSKILVGGLIVFFPVLVNTMTGLRAVPRPLTELMRSLRASPWQILWHLEIPAALPVFLSGLKMGATLSVIGAVVGELVGANGGLGFLINLGRGQFDTALVFVATFTLAGMALLLYGAVHLLEKTLLAWQEKA